MTPDLVGPSITRNAGIIGEAVDLNLEQLEKVRQSTLLFHLTKRLLETKWRDPGEEPKLHLFGQLKRITNQWLDSHLVCKGETFPAQLMYQELADMACNRITNAITRRLHRRRGRSVPSSTPTTPKEARAFRQLQHIEDRARGKPRCKPLPRQLGRLRQRLGGGVLPRRGIPSARAGLRQEPQPRLRGVPAVSAPKSASTGPTSLSSSMMAASTNDLLHLIVEIKGYRREDAKEKKSTMETYWVPGVNHLGTFGRWAFVEITDVYFESSRASEARVAKCFDEMIEQIICRHVRGGGVV